MPKFRLSSDAERDLMRIHHYGLRSFGEEQADKYINSLFDQFEIIAERPFAFESVDFIKSGYRRCVCGVDSIYYRVQNDIVEIMAIVGRQDLKNIL